MKNIILIVDEKHYEFDEINQLKNFIMPDFQDFSDEELAKKLYEKIFGYSIFNELQIVLTGNGVFDGNYEIKNENINTEKSIIVNNLDTFILSLCKHNVIILLEEKHTRYFTKNIDVQTNQDNYVVVNAYVDELLASWVGEKF